jgi:hypothetical protein
VLIIKDDIVFNSDTLCNITKDTSCIIYDSKQQIDSQNIGVTVINGHATVFSYDLPDKWCQIVYLTDKDRKILQGICNKRERSKMYLHEALDLMLQRIGKIKAIEPVNMEIMKIDTSKHLLQIRETQ